MSWRSAEFQASARAVLDAEQLKRFLKIYTDPFYVMRVSREGDAASFDVRGSTMNRYVVRFSGATGRFSCDCPDALMHCRRRRCVCKHAVFVLVRMLRRLDFSFFAQGNAIVDPAERASVQARIDELLDVPEASLIDELVKETTALALREACFDPDPDKVDPDKVFADDDECPVCYDTMKSCGASEIARCPTCRNHVHTACVVKWLSAAVRRTCVMCRSPAWQRFRR